jgi:hypothetical protein
VNYHRYVSGISSLNSSFSLKKILPNFLKGSKVYGGGFKVGFKEHLFPRGNSPHRQHGINFAIYKLFGGGS